MRRATAIAETRRQEGSLKLGFAENYAAPEIGLYGNHISRFFGGDAFGRPGDAAYFFNYWFANLALPEIYRYLRHIEQLGHLPRRLLLVQITSPNIDNGHYIINFGYELPPDLLLISPTNESLIESVSLLGAYAWEVVENWLHETLNYSTFILSFMQSGYEDRLIAPADCKPTDTDVRLPAMLQHLPWAVQNIFLEAGVGRNFCDGTSLSAAFRRDGSNDDRYPRARLIKDQDPLIDSQRGLVSGDEYEIARQFRLIDAVGRRHGVRVVFFLPPTYESNRDDSVVNQVFNRALALIPEVAVVDDRKIRGDPTFFVDYLHPAAKYFHFLVDELRSRGFLGKGEGL